MKDIKFENGTLKVTDKKTAMFLAFSQSNSESEKYNAVEKSLPKIKGLKRPIKRAEFAFDLVGEMNKNGLSVEFKGK